MAIDFQRIVFFGDSLTDDGNLPEPVRSEAIGPFTIDTITSYFYYVDEDSQQVSLAILLVATVQDEAVRANGQNLLGLGQRLAEHVRWNLAPLYFDCCVGREPCGAKVALVIHRARSWTDTVGRPWLRRSFFSDSALSHRPIASMRLFNANL